MAINFPIANTDGQIFIDPSSNTAYRWSNTYTAWRFALGSGIALAGNGQVTFINNYSTTTSTGLVFNQSSNTLFTNTINSNIVNANTLYVSGYLYGNGSFLTGVSGSGSLLAGANVTIAVSDNVNAALYIVQSGNKAAFFANTRQNTYPITIDANGNVAIGNLTTSYALQVFGSFAAQTKSFVIDHPTKPGMKLRYASLEGPENGVYIRGRSKENVIRLPEYWTNLVDYDSITVNITPIGHHQHLYVKKIEDNLVYVSSDAETFREIDYYYTVYAERKDVEKLVIEI